jgi:hypothetical protein
LKEQIIWELNLERVALAKVEESQEPTIHEIVGGCREDKLSLQLNANSCLLCGNLDALLSCGHRII